MSHTAYFTKRDGQIINTYGIKRVFKECGESGDFEVIIRSRKKRSNPQNRFFHSILPELQKGFYEAGWDNILTPEDAKWKVKKMFLTVKVENEKTGEVDEYVKRTRDLNKEEMTVFIEQVLQMASEYLGVVIFSPNEQSSFDYMYGE